MVNVYPRKSTATVLFKASAFNMPFSVPSEDGAEKEVKPEPAEGGEWWQLPLNGATDYRFPAGR